MSGGTVKILGILSNFRYGLSNNKILHGRRIIWFQLSNVCKYLKEVVAASKGFSL